MLSQNKIYHLQICSLSPLPSSCSKRNAAHLAFSLILEREPPSLDFVAPDEQTYNYWLDGVNALLRE